MNNAPKFLKSNDGEHIIEVICCHEKDEFQINGEQMAEMTANTSEGAAEKHLPVIEIKDNEVIVKVGSIFHPMTDEHSIVWVYLHTEKGGQRVNLSINKEPEAKFIVAEGDKAIAAYAYCNLHGFWKTEI